MNSHQTRTIIRDTLDRTWLDFHQRMAEDPRSTRLDEYVDCSAREAWRCQGKRRFGRLLSRCTGSTGSTRNPVEHHPNPAGSSTSMNPGNSTQTHHAPPPPLQDSNPQSESPTHQVDISNRKANKTSRNHPCVQPYDGAHPFWDTPHLPLPPTRRRTRDKPHPPCPTYQTVICYQSSSKTTLFNPQPQRIRVYHRPGFLEPFSHGTYVPLQFTQPLNPLLPESHPTKLALFHSPTSKSNPTSKSDSNSISETSSGDLREYGSPVVPLRRYKFCYPLDRLTWVPTELVWQFRPVYDGRPGHYRDEREGDGDERGLGKMRALFEGGVAWEEEDRDADSESPGRRGFRLGVDPS